MFDAAVRTAEGEEFELGVDLPTAWARRHESLAVAFTDERGDVDFGWHAQLVGDDGEGLLSFPWFDHADRALAARGERLLGLLRGRLLFPQDDFPTTLADEGWNELEQGWWGRVIPDGLDVFVAETDFDAITDAAPGQIVRGDPGHVFVNGVHVAWNVVSRDLYDRAWQTAIASCRRGRPSPVGELDPASCKFLLRA